MPFRERSGRSGRSRSRSLANFILIFRIWQPITLYFLWIGQIDFGRRQLHLRCIQSIDRFERCLTYPDHPWSFRVFPCSNNVGSCGGEIGSVVLQEAEFTVRILSPPVLDLLQELGVYSNHAIPTIVTTFDFPIYQFSFPIQLLRVQSPEGTKRIEILPSATVRDLYEHIHNAFELNGYGFAVYRERNYTKELASSRSQTIDDHNLKHGDMIYLKNVLASSSSVTESFLVLNCHRFHI